MSEVYGDIVKSSVTRYGEPSIVQIPLTTPETSVPDTDSPIKRTFIFCPRVS